MGYISVSGIGFAVLIGVLATSTQALAAEPQDGELRVQVSQLRNQKGMVHACLTQSAEHFPDCEADASSLKLSVPAKEAGELHFRNLAAGTYSVSIIHDENGNGKLDTFVAIPREGFGFSGNPPIRFGPPKFGEASFRLNTGRNTQVVRVRYLL